jgi:hypothetical protein
MSLLFSWCNNYMLYAEAFDASSDPFCRAVGAYVCAPKNKTAQNMLYHQMHSLSPKGFLSQTRDMHDTRLFYLIKCLWHAGILESNVLVVRHFLELSEQASRSHERIHPLFFQLFVRDVHDKSVYDFVHGSSIHALTTLVDSAYNRLVEPGVLRKDIDSDAMIQDLVHVHLDLLQWELYNGKISDKAYQIEHAALLEQLKQPLDLAGLFTYQNMKSCHVFDRLLQLGCNSYEFSRVFSLLNKAHDLAWISPDAYRHCLVDIGKREHYCMLHELLYRGDVVMHPELDANNLKDYLASVDALRAQNRLTHDTYVALFTQENRSGFSVVHQAVNAPNMKSTQVFMAWFDKNPYLSDDDKLMLLSYKSKNKAAQAGAKRSPCRKSKDGMRYVHHWLRDHKRRLHETCIPHAESNVSEHGLFGLRALTVDTSAVNKSSDGTSHQETLSWTTMSGLSLSESPLRRATSRDAAFSPTFR